MTRSWQNPKRCPNCGTEVPVYTPFSQWLRQLEKPLDSKTFDNENLDYIWHNYLEHWFITIEEKQYGARSTRAQQDTHQIVAQMLAYSSNRRVKTMRGLLPVEYRGHYCVTFHRTTPDDSEWITVNGRRVTRESLKHLLSCGSLPVT